MRLNPLLGRASFGMPCLISGPHRLIVSLTRASLLAALVFALCGLALAQEQSTQYEVQPGETLFGIALSAGLAVDDLAALNGLSDPDAIYAGQILMLSVAAAPAPEAAV